MVRAVDHDNRGDSDVAYGFVYFADGRRVVYATGYPLDGGTGGWAAVTSAHIAEAKRYLTEQGISL